MVFFLKKRGFLKNQRFFFGGGGLFNGGGVVCKNPTPPATVLFLFNDYFFSSGQGQGCPIALKVGRCASTFRR